MALKTLLTKIRFFTAADPYFYTVDNRPITDLESRDAELADALDAKVLHVDIAGAATPTINYVPSGWTVVRNSAGTYTITHTLNTTAISVTGITVGGDIGVVTLGTVTATTFVVKTYNLSGAATDLKFNCMISIRP